MKQLTRYCSVFFCAVLLSIAFSVNASADETYLENLQIDIVTKLYGNTGYEYSTQNKGDLTIYPNNGTQESSSYNGLNVNKNYPPYTLKTTWKVTEIDGNILFKGKSKTNLTLSNGYFNIGYQVKSGTTVISSTYIKPTNNRALIGYYDGTYEYVELSGTVGTPTTLYIEFTPTKDVTSIEFQFNSDELNFNDSKYTYQLWFNTGEYVTDKSFNIMIDTESVEAGLLSGIIGWIKNIYDSIVNLPSKLWGLISDGLKSLFVPSEEYLTQFKNDMDTLLSEKLGAIYQVVNILTEGWDRIQANDSTNTIDFPQVTIPLPDNNEFTFGGQTVSIVPDGFDFLVTAIKLIVGICCTILFVNGLKKRYDDIMGG